MRLPCSTPTLMFLLVAAASAYFGALGPAHSAELLGLAAFVLLASLARHARPRRSAALRTR